MTFRLQAGLERARGYGSAVLLELAAPEIAARAVPGQFVQVLCGDDSPRVLRRPYSIFYAAEGLVSLLVKPVGKGSRWLAERRRGDVLDLVGPLGKGFEVEGGEVGLVAGGTGIAPLYFLAARLAGSGGKPRLFWGMESGGEFEDLPRELERSMGANVATMDGSLGKAGSVLDALPPWGDTGFRALCACGPLGMLRALRRYCDEGGIPLQVSLEERMACGVGACQGCAVPVKEDPPGYRMVCRDGPVFDAEDLDWESESWTSR